MQNTAVWLTLQSLHTIQLGEELIDHTVGHPRAVVAPPGGQRVKLIEEQDAWFSSLRSGMDKENYSHYMNGCYWDL